MKTKKNRTKIFKSRVQYYLLFILFFFIFIGLNSSFWTNSKAQIRDDLSSAVMTAAFSEGFENITTLPARDWFTRNNSVPVGSTGWFQGNSAVFPAQSGANNSYIGANFNNTTGTNTISNWLLTPNITFNNGDVIKFWTRSPANNPFPDRLEVRLSTVGASTNVGTGSAAVGDFTTLLRSINPALTVGGYPEVWTEFTITLSGLAGPTSGRIGFRYFVTMGGPTGDNSNYIGIDNFSYAPATVTCVSLEQDLVSWWAGDGNTFDYQGSNQGTLGGNAAFAAGKVQQAFNFDGDDDFVSIADNDTLDVQTGDFSIDGWVNLRSSREHFVGGKDSCTINSYALSVGADNKPKFRLVGSDGSFEVVAANAVTLNAWHHLAAVKEGSNIKIYVNGALAGTQAVTGTFGANDLSFRIGGREADGEACPLVSTDGLIDELDVFNRALMLAEVQSIFAAGSAGKCHPALLLSIDPNPVMGGRAATGTFTLSNPAPAGGALVTLTSSDPNVAIVPASITIPENQTSGTFTITTPTRSADAVVNITGTYNGLSKTTTLSVARSVPDLRITDAAAPAEVGTANAFELTWTDLNDGIVATGSNWSDQVFFSTNNMLDGNDRSLGTLAFNGTLAPDQSAAQTGSVIIPPSAITADGDYFLIIRADTFGNVNEGSFENNNLFVKPIRVLRRAPDLQVPSLIAPAEINTTEPFGVSWTEKNFGTAPAAPAWNDTVYFSTDNQIGSDIVLGTLSFSGTVAPNEAIDRSIASLTIPPSAITATGDYFIYVRADSGNILDEGGGASENNNFTFRPVRVNLVAPDLRVSDISAPGEVSTTASFNLTWTDKNFGNGRANASWTDYIYFSSDNQVGSDLLLSTLVVNSSLEPNQTVDSTSSVTIPSSAITADGDYFIYVQTDRLGSVNEGPFENNNITFKPVRVLLRVPDLQVTAVGAAAEVETEQEFEVSWTVANTGAGRANPTWRDCVYFSPDNQVGADANLGCFDFSQGLDPKQTAERIQGVHIPLNSITQTGNYFIYVQTDVNNTVDEGPTGNNNNRSAFRPLRVRRTLRPDLTVPSVVAPDTAFFDQGIQIQWTVTNNGPGSTNASEWSDRIYLSSDTTISADDRDLGGRQNVSYLNAGESYIAIADINLPRGLFGNLFLLVKTDINNGIGEDNETNNVRAKAISVQVPPLPDLQVPFVQAPEEAFAGQTILLNWRVENRGTRHMTPQETSWSDRIYLSPDTTFNPATDRLIATRSNSAGALAQNAGYTVNGFAATLPLNIIGNWYVFVVTDADSQIYEFTGENNNFNYDNQQPGSPVLIRATPPDLTIIQPLAAPATASAGTQIAVSFTVKNQGAFDAAPSWADKIYLSSDNTLDTANDFDLGTTFRASPLGAGLEYTVNTNVRIPECLSGTYYLFALSDGGNQIFEFDPKIDAEANNTSQSRQIQINNIPPDLRVAAVSNPANGTPGQPVQINWTTTNTGTGATQTGDWYDRVLLSSSPVLGNGSTAVLGSFLRSGAVLAPNASSSSSVDAILPANLPGGEWYVFVTTDLNNTIQECGGESNNTTASPTTLTTVANPTLNNQPDLRINAISTMPENARPGEPITLQWTGANNGNLDIPPSNWNDSVYISTDMIISPDDMPLGGALISRMLPAGATYQAQLQTTLPNLGPGNYFLIVGADTGNHIFEGNFENNNSGARPLTVAPSPVDLQVTGINVPPTSFSGQNISISYTVTNTSATATFATSWTDYVILSRDLIIDSTDRTLANFGRGGALDAGAGYTITGDVFIPTGLTGEYNVFVIADRGNLVFESNEANNVSAPGNVALQLPPPSDLVVQNVNLPSAQVVPGEESTFSWTVQNAGNNPAPGNWSDSVYLSTDQTWDINDVLIGQKPHAGPLVPAATYNGTLTATIPAMNLGAYYVIVRTDTRNLVRELVESNNVQASTSTSIVDVTELQLGVPRAANLNTNQERFYKVAAPANETLLVTLNGENGASNELYTRFGQMVSRSQYDFLFSRPYEANQETLVPNTGAGTYYNLARADFIPAAAPVSEQKAGDSPPKENNSLAENVTIKAEILPFDIRRVAPSQAGNGGYAALTVEGAKFQSGATVKLVRQGIELLPLNSRAETSRLAAVFDLRGQATGAYDVVVRNPDGQTKTLTAGFTIVQGGGHDVSVRVTGPDSVRPDNYGRFTVSVQNNGLNDALLTQLFIFVPTNSNYRLSREGELPINPADLPAGLTINDIPIHTVTENGKSIPILIHLLRRGDTLNINIDVQPPPGSTSFPVRASVIPPMLQLDASGLRRAAGDNSGLNCLYFAVKEIFTQILQPKLVRLIGGICAEQVADFLLERMTLLTDLIYGASTDQVNDYISWETAASVGLSSLRVIIACTAGSLPLVRALQIIADVVDIAYKAWDLYQRLSEAENCVKALTGYDYKQIVSVLRPSDPNDKIGPSGYSALKFVPARQILNYRINFENMPTATAYAQKIRITDQLPNTLDPRTLRLKEIGFGNYRFAVPDNRAFYQNRAPLGADLNNLLVDISAGLDISSGRVTWTLTAIDPVTGEQPANPNVGLLPPNDENNSGQGYVIFTVQPKTTGTTGTVIANNATIIFDTEPPIITNTVSNTLDAAAPTTGVSALPNSSAPTIDLQWSGADDANGSGLQNFDIWVSENGGVYQPLISGTSLTSAQFVGRYGRNYRFYSTARDNAGNVESPPEVPDAMTTVVGGAYEADVSPRPNGNNDGAVNDDDVSQIRRFAAALDSEFLHNEIQRADVAPIGTHGDAVLSVGDVVQGRRFALGLDAVTFADGPLTLNFAGKSAAKLLNAPRAIRPVRISRIGNKLLLGIMLEAQGDEVGAGFTLNFDPNVLSNPSNINLGSDAAGAVLTINSSQISQSKLGILIDKNPNQPFAAGSRQIATLEFDVISNTAQTTVIGFADAPVINEIVNGNAAALTGDFSPSTIVLIGPTAANVTIGGKVTNANGIGIGNVLISLTDQNGTIRRTRTSPFGYYRFEDVTVGQIYLISAQHKKYQFIQPTIAVELNEERDDLNFIAQK
jgi:subtilase family serine protease